MCACESLQALCGGDIVGECAIPVQCVLIQVALK